MPAVTSRENRELHLYESSQKWRLNYTLWYRSIKFGSTAFRLFLWKTFFTSVKLIWEGWRSSVDAFFPGFLDWLPMAPNLSGYDFSQRWPCFPLESCCKSVLPGNCNTWTRSRLPQIELTLNPPVQKELEYMTKTLHPCKEKLKNFVQIDLRLPSAHP